ncbi:sialate O-acetylesterase [Vibrio sp. 1978]|uniref:sialate O-acetylesterase n=1 Tax=Vibrio sp. 1978 TaxID=3074585 RepID=UPI0029661488|nr:sialate O-acetylesterase [Vibrio sp. 1978]MDW3058297.1 sialate O-acetylesterase [Vibrio sp. 1978]
MTQNIEQRTEAAVTKYEGAADKIEQFAETDSTLSTAAGPRKSFPKLSREIEESIRLGAANHQGIYAVGVTYDQPNWTYTFNGQQWGLSANFDLSTLAYEATQADPNNDPNLAVRGEASQEYVQFEISKRLDVDAVDLFVVVGQSNAEGRGESYSSPSCPTGLYFNGSDLLRLSDPVGGANSGSMWPSFANEWHSQTGKRAVIIDYAVGGTTLSNDGEWSPSGSLRGNAVNGANNAINAIENSDLYKLENVYFIWLQGESDADNGVSSAIYQSDLEDLAAYFRSQIIQSQPLQVCMIGRKGGTGGVPVDDIGNNNNGTLIRKAQWDAGISSADVNVIYSGATRYLGECHMNDGLHFNQFALNKIGRCCALRLADNYPDSSFSTLKKAPFRAVTSTQTVNNEITNSLSLTHVPDMYADTIIVVAGATRDSSATNISLNATFNNVPMRLVSTSKSFSSGFTRLDFFQITQEEFGIHFGRKDIEITVNSSSNCNFIGFAVYDLQGVEHVSDVYIDEESLTPTDTLTTNTPVFEPSIVISAISTIGDGNVAPTTTFSGSSVQTDNGVIDTGSTRVMNLATGYSQEESYNTSLQVISTTSQAQTESVMTTLALRRKIKGE